MRAAVVYFSHGGVTASLAAAVAQGLESQAQSRALLHRIEPEDIVAGRYDQPELMAQLSRCQAIIFGSPTYMGGVAAQFKAFCDSTSELWTQQQWAGKIAAGFSVGSGYNGDQSSTLNYLVTFAAQHGMLWCGIDAANGYDDRGINRLGCQMGALAHAPAGVAEPADLATARYLGQRVAQQCQRIHHP